MHYLLIRFVLSGLAITGASLSGPGLAAQVAKTQRGFFCDLPLAKQIAPVLFEITLNSEPASDLISESLRASFSHYKGLKRALRISEIKPVS